MTPDLLVVTICLALVALALGACGLFWGLYLGERGRRRAAETNLIFGAPEAKPARRVMPHVLPTPIEPRQAPKGFDEGTISKGAEAILAQAAEAGIHVSVDQARQMAEEMLGSALEGGELSDLAIG